MDPLLARAGGGDGVVPSVEEECAREPLESLESELINNDWPVGAGGVGKTEEEVEDNSGLSTRRRTDGEGPSECALAGIGPRKKDATAWDAES